MTIGDMQMRDIYLNVSGQMYKVLEVCLVQIVVTLFTGWPVSLPDYISKTGLSSVVGHKDNIL
jgi:hypothetical protein